MSRMAAHWGIIALLAVGQLGDELPERLPPVPIDAPSHALAFPFYGRAHPWAQPAETWSPTSQPTLQQYPAPQSLSLPPPPGDAIPANQPLQQLPGATVYEEAWSEPELPATRISFATLGAGTGFSTTTFDVNHTWLLGYGGGPPLQITPGFGMHFWGDGVGLGLPPRVYDLYLDLNWTAWTGEWWTVSVGLTPGLYTDFAHASGDMFQLTGWIVGNRPLGDHWQLVIGAAYVRQLQTTLIPVGGVIWTPHDDVRLELVFPKPKYAVRYRETNEGSRWLYVAGQLGGGAWSVADGTNDAALVGYSDWRILLGMESFRVDGREWSIELGYAFSRELTIDNRLASTPGSCFSLLGCLAF